MNKDDNYDGILRNAFVIEDLPDDFNPNKVPQTGEEYIHHVMYEARQCKEWVTANIDREKFCDKQTSITSGPSGLTTAPELMLPTIEWQNNQVTDFSAFRLHIQKLKQQNTTNEIRTFNGEAEQWHRKCLQEPKLSDLLFLSQKNLCKILDFYLIWLDEIPPKETLPYSLGVWLYSIISCLETPLMPETCYTLRDIARKCSYIRSLLPQDSKEDQYKILNLFICLIARYFRNYDLMDNSNEI